MNTIFLVLTIIGLVGIYYYLLIPNFENYYRTRIVSKGVLREFVKIGFSDEKVLVKGEHKNYFIVLNHEWFDHFSRKILRIHIMFEPLTNTKEELTQRNKLLKSKYDKKYSWFLNEMIYLIHYNFKAPNFEKIIKKIEDMIAILKDENLLPISEIESDKIQSKYEYWQDQIS